MQKDKIYIEAEDDITDIISKVKSADADMVVLIPPKQLAVLQSAVNLRLLKRAAAQKKKQLVVVTANEALGTLALSAGIATAKTLRSKPTLPEDTQQENTDTESDDVIDGRDVAVGDYEDHEKKNTPKSKEARIVEEVDVEETITAPQATPQSKQDTPAKETLPSAKKKREKAIKVPDFSRFRRRFLIAIVLLVAIGGALTWAFRYAPAADITVTMKTSEVNVSQRVSVAPDKKTNYKAKVIQSVEKNIKESVSIPYTATGEKNIGKYATGVVTVSALSYDPVLVSEGTVIRSSGGSAYRTTQSVTIPASTLRDYLTTGSGKSVSVGVKAVEPGELFNGASGSAEIATDGVSAVFSETTTGGTTEIAKVVKESDLQEAISKVAELKKNTTKQKELQKKFGDSMIPIAETMNITTGSIKPTVEAGQTVKEGTELAFKGNVEYSMKGIAYSEIETYVSALLKEKIADRKDQKVYNSGVKDAQITGVTVTNDGVSVGLAAVGKIGPVLTEDEIVKRSIGKKAGEVAAELKTTQGVDDVTVSFSYFWVTTVPNNPEKISVEFVLDEAK